MAKKLKICIIGAGSAQFSLGMVKDLCLTENLRGSHVWLMDIDEGRLDMIYKLATRYASQLGASLTFDKTTDRNTALYGADYVINTGYVLGHVVEANLRDLCWRFRLLPFRRRDRPIPPVLADAQRGQGYGKNLSQCLVNPGGQPPCSTARR